MFLFTLLIATTFAADPTPTAVPTPSTAPFAQETYVSELLKERDQVGMEAALGACTVAKHSFLEAQSRLATINAELALPLNENLGGAQITYRRNLTTEKAVFTAQLSRATESAKVASTAMATARARTNAINAELDRVNKASPVEEDEYRPFVAVQNPLPVEFVGCFPSEVLYPVHTNRQIWPTPPTEDDRPTLQVVF